MNTTQYISFSRRVIKYLLYGLGTIVFTVVTLIAWIYFELLSGPGFMEIDAYNPFPSAKAQNQYYTFESAMKIKWPVNSEE